MNKNFPALAMMLHRQTRRLQNVRAWRMNRFATKIFPPGSFRTFLMTWPKGALHSALARSCADPVRGAVQCLFESNAPFQNSRPLLHLSRYLRNRARLRGADFRTTIPGTRSISTVSRRRCVSPSFACAARRRARRTIVRPISITQGSSGCISNILPARARTRIGTRAGAFTRNSNCRERTTTLREAITTAATIDVVGWQLRFLPAPPEDAKLSSTMS